MRKGPRWTQRYRGGWRACPTVMGRRVYGDRRATEQEAHEDALALRQRGTIRKRHGVVTLEMGLDLLMREARARDCRPGHMRFLRGNVGQILRRFEPDSELAAFTREHIDEWIEDRIQRDGVSKVSASKNRSVMVQLFNEAMARGWVQENPAKTVVRRRSRVRKKKGRAYEWADLFECVLPSIEEVDRAAADLIRLHAYTGLRRAEMARVAAEDITADGVTIDGKTDDRVLPAPPALLHLFRKVCPLPGSTEERRIDHVRRTFQRWGRRLSESEFGSHTMRRTFTSELARRRVPRDVIKGLIGHRPQAMDVTDLYIVVHDDDMRRALGLLVEGREWHGGTV